MKRVCVLAVLAILTFHLYDGPTYAQSAANSGQIGGQVLDPSGGAVADADVTIRNADTNYIRSVKTDSAGRYAVGPLPLGTYEVTATPANMAPSAQTVYVGLGARASADFHLGLAPLSESVDVGGRSEPTQTFSKSVLTDLQLRNLPAPGRRIKNLFLLTPTSQIEPECGGFSVSGQKGIYSSFNVDGGDYTSSHFCGHVEMGPTFAVEALQEFQVLRSTFSAEFGRSTGGVINLATKSGTNQLRGSALYLLRNDGLTARDPYDREQINTGSQFGGSIGGPIAADRTFFFAAGEGQHNTKPVNVLFSELDRQSIRNTPGAQALLAAAPESELTAVSQLQTFVGKIDHRLTANNTLTGRFDFTRNKVTSVVGSFINSNGLGADSITNRDVTNASPTSNRNNVTGMLQFSSVLGPKQVNELRLQLAHEYRPWNPGLGPEVTVREGSPIQTVAIYGPQATGLSYGNVGYQFADNRVQVVDNFSIVSGAHTTKIGFDADLVFSDVTFDPGSNGIYRFDGLDNYLARRPAQYTQFAGMGSVDSYKHSIAMYVQDEWRLGPGFTVSPGFRYEMTLLPDYQAATAPQNRAPLATHIPDDKEMIAPRLGTAWDIHQNGKTVVRAAAGLFYAPAYATLFEQAITTNGGNPELSSQISLNTTNEILAAFYSQGLGLAGAPLNDLPVFTLDQLNALSAPGSRLTQATNVFYFDPNFKLPRSAQFRAALDRQIASGITASIDYTHIAVSRMDRVRDINLPTPTIDATGRPVYTPSASVSVNSLRPDPRFGAIYVTESSARSLYRGMTTSINVRRPQYIFDAAYTLGFSKSYDDHENGGYSSANYVDASNLQNEYGWSNIDQRHQFTANGVVFLPYGLEAATQMRFNSGRPFSPRTGVDSNRDGILNDRPLLNGEVVRRNDGYRKQAFSDVSLRLQKNFSLPGEKQVGVSAEFFNIFNVDNMETNQINWGNDLGVPTTNALFGRVLDQNGAPIVGNTLRTTPFQVQLGLRFQF